MAISIRRTAAWLVPLLAWMAVGQTSAHGQAMFDRRIHQPMTRSFEIRDVSIDATIRNQVADVQVAQTFYNPGSTVLESEYFFPLPDEGAVQNFVLMVDGKEMPGRLLPKDEARRIYEEIVRTKRDPALLEYMGRGLFRTSVFPIPPGAERKVTLRYTQICKRDRDVVEFVYPLSSQRFTAKPIAKLGVTVRIDSKEPIKSIYSPVYDTTTQRSGEHEAKAEFHLRDVVPSQDFRLVYTLSEGSIGASIVSYRPSESEDGYFLMLASPQVKPPDGKPLPKSVVFVIDRSGSMAGKKIEQAKNALTFVLNNLRDDDTFNVVAYDDRVELFKPELQRYNSTTRDAAVKFVANIHEGGSTNISDALKSSLEMLKDDSRPNYVIFLTDGLPTAGETGEVKISEIAKTANKVKARVFSFGVGYDVNARLLDRLSGNAGGTSEYVTPDQDIEKSVGSFYAKMTRPALASIGVALGGVDVNRTYPRDIPDLFEGGQVVWVGRYRQSGPTTVKLTGKVGGETRSLEFPADLAPAGRGSANDFVEKLWAIRRVGFIIDQVDMHGQNKELIDELVNLSRRYGILTPYTSFLADERVNLHASLDNAKKAGVHLEQLAVVGGQSGVSQRGGKQLYMNADKAGAMASVPSGAASAPLSRPGLGGGMGGGMGGMTGGMGGQAKATGSGNIRVFARGGGTTLGVNPGRDNAAGSRMPLAVGTAGGGAGNTPGAAGPNAGAVNGTSNVRSIGGKTFYRKANRWVDSEVKPEDEAKAKDLVQFSDDYFKIARGQSADNNQYFSIDEPVTVKVDGQTYRVDPPKTADATK